MRYSVIVPTYNEEHYVARCLQSIRDQQYERAQYEIIVADADSSDGTRRVAVPLADEFVTTGTRGIAIGRNLGAANASGELFVFVDADAILEQDFLSQLDLAFHDPNVVAVTGLARPSDGRIFQQLVYRGTYVLVQLFVAAGIPLFPGICVAYRADAFRRANGFREDFGIVEDLDLSRRVSATGKCVVSRKAIAHVSTRRLGTHAFSTVLFHIYNDLRYLLTGRAAPKYPKHEELRTWTDLWRS